MLWSSLDVTASANTHRHSRLPSGTNSALLLMAICVLGVKMRPQGSMGGWGDHKAIGACLRL